MKKLIFALLIIVFLGAAYWSWPKAGDNASKQGLGLNSGLFSCKKGPLRVTITSSGTLKARKSTQIRSEIKSQGKITFLVPEGSAVKEGDLLVEMDKTDMQKQADSLEMNKIQFESELASAKTEVEIQKGDNQSNIEKAQLKLEFAKLNQEKYENGEGPQERRKLQLSVDKAISDEGRAKDKFESMPDLLKEGFVTEDQVEEERIKYQSAKIEHQSSSLALELFEKYTFPMTLRQKASDVTDAQRDYDRAVQKSQSMLQQKEAILSQKERQLKSNTDQFERTKVELDHMTIKSPGTGLVVYGDPEQRWWSSEDRLKVGGYVYNNQIIMTLPDLSESQVLMDVHETDITKVAMNQAVTVTCDTFPGKIFPGKITKIAALARTEGWRDDAAKKFQVEVTLEGKDHGLKPGLSAKCEVLVEVLDAVLYVPLQSVFVEEGSHHCYVTKGNRFEKRSIKLGKSNDNFIVIDEGLSEGEAVAIYNPETGEGQSAETSKPGNQDNAKSPTLPQPGQ